MMRKIARTMLVGAALAAPAAPVEAGQYGDWFTNQHGGECGLMTVGAPEKLHVLFRSKDGNETVTAMSASGSQWRGGSALSMKVDGDEVATLPMLDLGAGELVAKLPPSLLIAMTHGTMLHAEFWERGKQAPTMERDVSLFGFDRAVQAWRACAKGG
jgi:hypothetical protein